MISCHPLGAYSAVTSIRNLRVGKYENLNMIDRGTKYNVEVNVLASFIVLIK